MQTSQNSHNVLEGLEEVIQEVKQKENALHSAKSSEHSTPQKIIALSREVLEGIDLDPFSSEFFNARVRAKRYYSQADDGLKLAWFSPIGYSESWEPSSIFLNPPTKLYPLNAKGKIVEKSGAKEAWKHLLREVELNHVSHAIVIAYSLEQLQITQKGCSKSMLDFPLCIGADRFDYVNVQGQPLTSGTHSSAVVYVPNLVDNTQKFKELFSSIGKVLNA